ncbi:hypothetical protein ACH4TM_10665 [Streptomyces parvus]|uniref:hypothetical protein n=1 Tax=Streptomyces TaxID=1883 RepID=UPI00131EE341|nr:hypothetical protein [Streptomyces sp. CS149]
MAPGGPRPNRDQSFQELKHLLAGAAPGTGEGGAYLRQPARKTAAKKRSAS